MATVINPPNKFVQFNRSGMTPDQIASELTTLWNTGFTGPYLVIGDLIFVGGFITEVKI